VHAGWRGGVGRKWNFWVLFMVEFVKELSLIGIVIAADLVVVVVVVEEGRKCCCGQGRFGLHLASC
jgi:hypothetical protein